MKDKRMYSSWVEIDLGAIRQNYEALKRLAVKQFDPAPLRIPILRKQGSYPQILPVIKADAYGHGMEEVAGLLDKAGVKIFCVSDLAEGIALRRQGIRKPILLLESTLPGSARDIIKHNLTASVTSWPLAVALNRQAQAAKKVVDVHVNVDTGMNRLGINFHEAEDFINRIFRLRHLRVQGIYTHFPVADTHFRFTMNQIHDLYKIVRTFDRQGKVILYVHATNSMGLAGYKHHIFNLARPGLMLYGLYPSVKLRSKVSLKPAMSVKSKIIFIKSVPAGTGISYGHTFVTKKKMTVATLPIGYRDGYLRCLSNKSYVLVNGKRCPVLGRVTMDQIMVDISKARRAVVGTEAVLMGQQGRETISADELAAWANTISYEMICSLGNRLPRIYKK